MTFGLALEHLKQGYKITRQNWNGKGMFLFLAKDIKFNTNCDIKDCEKFNTLDSIVMKTADNNFVVGWTASQVDMLAEDWIAISKQIERR